MTDKPKFKLRSTKSRIDIISQNGNDGLHYFEKSYLDQKRQMMEENERSEVIGKWISVEDRLPVEDDIVDIYSKSQGRLCNYIYEKDYGGKKDNNFFDPYYSGVCCVRDATHWMPTPTPPMEVE